MLLLTLLFFLLLFFFGAAMGSFAGVIIERSKEGFDLRDRTSVVGGRSYCPACGQTLRWWQLVPLLGRLVQGGRCTDCNEQIPVRYVRIEVVMGVVFVATFWVLIGTDLTVLTDQLAAGDRRVGVQLIFWLLVNRALTAILIADLKRYVLNTYMWLILLLITVGLFPIGWPALMGEAAVLGLVLGFVFFLLWLFGRWRVRIRYNQSGEGIGLGDVLLTIVIGMLAVFWPWSNLVELVQLLCRYLIVTSVLGIVYWLVRALLQQQIGQRLPFLPALIVGYYLVLLRGGKLLSLVAIFGI